MNINKSLYFKDNNGRKHFLLKLLNYGKDDDLKFIFKTKNEAGCIIYSPDNSFVSKEDIIKPYSEFTYHKDGNTHCKLPKHKTDNKNNYVNCIKKKSLNQIRDWEPIIKYIVVDYNICKISKKSNGSIFLPENNLIFNGDSFECVIWLGNMLYANPPNNNSDEMIFRINDVAENIDLILWIYKSSYRGKKIALPFENKRVFNKWNIIQIVGKKQNKKTCVS